ncbi:MAG: lysylphosphatidylglycerol synthase transmembrane domain-containing protein [Bacilli bacterium]|nr:lysylphosphatidylglycerol synthase transmembrane domain-containing protein [Bacilli bacterium]
MKKNKIKYIFNFLLIAIVLSIVLYFSLKDNYQEIISTILKMNYIWIFVAILALIIYRLCASLGHYYIIKANNGKVSYLKCFQINLMILFFHGITPFAGGGQPMEIYFLHKEGISVTKATNITLQNFIVYQIALIITGLIALIYNHIFNVFPNDSLIKYLVVLGFTINTLVLVVTFILSFGKKTNKFIIEKGIHFLSKIKIIKEEKKTQEKCQKYLQSFHDNAIELKKNKKIVAFMVLINIIGLMTMYSMPYPILRGMGININIFKVITAIAYVMIIGSFVPIPGGTGGIEYSFIFFFQYLISGSILHAAMLVWRLISYYLGMTFGAIALSLYRKKEKQCE